MEIKEDKYLLAAKKLISQLKSMGFKQIPNHQRYYKKNPKFSICVNVFSGNNIVKVICMSNKGTSTDGVSYTYPLSEREINKYELAYVFEVCDNMARLILDDVCIKVLRLLDNN